MFKTTKYEVKNAKFIKIPLKLNPQKIQISQKSAQKIQISDFPDFPSAWLTQKKNIPVFFCVFHTIRNENIFGLANTNKKQSSVYSLINKRPPPDRAI